MAHPHKYRTLWLAGILHAFTHLYHVVLLPLYFLMLQDPRLGLKSVEEATSLVTILMISYFVPAYPVGVLADRFSKRKLLAIGLAINALGFVLLSGASSYWQAACSVMVAGVGGSFFHPAATALVARLFPVGTGKALGLLGIGASAGFFLGPLYAGFRGQISGWRAPVLEVGIVGLVMAVVFWMLADEEPPHEAGSHVDRDHSGLFPSTGLLVLFVAASFAFSMRDFAGSSMGSLGSLFLQKVHLLSTEETGKILSCIFLASAISNPLFGRLSDRNPIGWTQFVLAISAVLAAVFPHVPVNFSALSLAVYGFFFMASYPMVEAVLMNSVPHQVRGRVFGVFITIGGLFGNLAHWLMGAWVKRLGPAGAEAASYFSLYACVGGMIALSLVGLPCLRTIRSRESAAGELPGGLAPDRA